MQCIEKSKTTIIYIKPIMMIVMILVRGEKWQMVSWVAVDCVEIDYHMPNPNCNWMWPENQRPNPLRYRICQNKLQGMHVASRYMKSNKKLDYYSENILWCKNQSQLHIYTNFLPNATVAVHSWCILWIFGYNSRLCYKW